MEMSIKNFQRKIYEVINSVKQPIVLTSRGKKIAVLSPYDNTEKKLLEVRSLKLDSGDDWRAKYIKYRDVFIEIAFEQMIANPKKISPAHVFKAEELEVKREQFKDMMNFSERLAKTLCGELEPPANSIIEGEEIIDARLLRPENSSPTDSQTP